MGQGTIEKAAFTPGPWHVSGEPNARWVTSADTEANVICDIVCRQARNDATNDLAEDLANARLIAAAPDFYEAASVFLRGYRGEIGDVASYELRSKGIDMMMAAVRKAEGRAE